MPYSCVGLLMQVTKTCFKEIVLISHLATTITSQATTVCQPMFGIIIFPFTLQRILTILRTIVINLCKFIVEKMLFNYIINRHHNSNGIYYLFTNRRKCQLHYQFISFVQIKCFHLCIFINIICSMFINITMPVDKTGMMSYVMPVFFYFHLRMLTRNEASKYSSYANINSIKVLQYVRVLFYDTVFCFLVLKLCNY